MQNFLFYKMRSEITNNILSRKPICFSHFDRIAIYTNNDTYYHCIGGRDERRKRKQC